MSNSRGKPPHRTRRIDAARTGNAQGTPPNRIRDPTSPTLMPARPKPGAGPRMAGKLLGSLRKIVGQLRSGIPWFGSWAATMLTIFAAAVVFLPRITVEPSGPYDPMNPSPITFTITNSNFVPLRNVFAAVGVCDVTLPVRTRGGGSIVLKGVGQEYCATSGGPMTRVTIPDWQIKWLDADERWQLALEDVFPGTTATQIETANMTISLEYTPWYLPSFWRNLRQFRFVTKKRSDGKIYWVPTPLNP
jgi:hypothetical protein